MTISSLFFAVLAAGLLAMAMAACSSTSSSPPNSSADVSSLRPCPRYNNRMPVSLKTPCRMIGGKYYRTD